MFRDDAPVPMLLQNNLTFSPLPYNSSLQSQFCTNAIHASRCVSSHCLPLSLKLSPPAMPLKEASSQARHTPTCLHLIPTSHLNTNNRLSPLAPRPALERRHGIHHHDKQKDNPEQETKGISSLGRSAVGIGAAARRPMKNSQSDRPGKPEDHGDPLQRERDGALERLGEVRRE